MFLLHFPTVYYNCYIFRECCKLIVTTLSIDQVFLAYLKVIDCTVFETFNLNEFTKKGVLDYMH